MPPQENSDRLMRLSELARYLSVSPIIAKRFGEECGAEIKFSSRCYRYDKTLIDAELARRAKAQQ
jgi:hypothetical protein